MYTKKVPFKDFKGQPRNMEVNFNLTETEVFKLLGEFQAVFNWQESTSGEKRDLTSDEVIEFYTAFENILLASWGEPSDDGLHFRKAGRYDFEESALFSATMMEFVTNPEETGKLLDGIMPEGLTDLVKKADANLIAASAKAGAEGNAELQDEVERLRAQLAASQTPPVA